MARTRVKNKWISTIAGVLVLVLAIGAVVGLTSIGSEDKTTVTSLSFSVGGISTQTGKGINTSTSVYTEDRIACQGLSVVPSFSCSSTYQIFFYNEDDVFVRATEVRSDTFDASAIPAGGRYARIVIYPSTLDENGKQIEDFKIHLWDVRSIVKDFEITVNETQTTGNLAESAVSLEYASSLVFPPVADLLVEGAAFDKSANSWSGMSAAEASRVLVVDVSHLSKVKLAVSSEGFLAFDFVNENGKLVFEAPVLPGSPQVVDVGSAAYIVVNLTSDIEFSVTEYMPR